MQRSTWPARIFGAVMFLLGPAGWWYNWHLATTEREFSIKLCVFVPLAIAGGLLMLIRPEWAGRWRDDAPRGHKIALVGVIGFMAIGSGVEFYRLNKYVTDHAPRPRGIRWSPEMGTPKLPASMARTQP